MLNAYKSTNSQKPIIVFVKKTSTRFWKSCSPHNVQKTPKTLKKVWKKQKEDAWKKKLLKYSFYSLKYQESTLAIEANTIKISSKNGQD